MKYLNTTDCSLFLAERSKFMTKYALIGLLAVCATVLCFSLIFRERLCELNIHRGNTVSGAGNSGLRSTEVSCRAGTEVPAFRECEVFQGQTPYTSETAGPARGRHTG
ncbi:Hok/Gef family protein [Escherichia coli]